jgi:hypothetical protein
LGIDIVIEFLPFASINTHQARTGAFRWAGHDEWRIARRYMAHPTRRYDSRGYPPDPAEFLRAVELNDAGPEVLGSLFNDSTHYRRLCGEGSIDIPSQMQAILDVGYRGYWGVEVISAYHRHLPLEIAAQAGFRHDDATVSRGQTPCGLAVASPQGPNVRTLRTLDDGKNRSARRWAHWQDPRSQRRGKSKATLVAVADPFANAAQPLAEAYGAEPMTDAMAAIERPDVDAVVIGTPTDTHVGFLLRAIALGKAVLCEKPIDLDMAKSESAASEVERAGGKVMLAFNRRFDSTFAEMRRAIDSRSYRRSPPSDHLQPRSRDAAGQRT